MWENLVDTGITRMVM